MTLLYTWASASVPTFRTNSLAQHNASASLLNDFDLYFRGAVSPELWRTRHGRFGMSAVSDADEQFRAVCEDRARPVSTGTGLCRSWMGVDWGHRTAHPAHRIRHCLTNCLSTPQYEGAPRWTIVDTMWP